MNLDTLIKDLQRMQVQHDTYTDLPVLTRGSSNTTMVPVEDVRIVRLKSGGTAVFIGKRKADRS